MHHSNPYHTTPHCTIPRHPIQYSTTLYKLANISSSFYNTYCVYSVGENEMKNECVENMDNSVNQITSEIVERAQAMKTRHIQQLRAFKNRSWFKKSKVCPSTATESSEIDADVTWYLVIQFAICRYHNVCWNCVYVKLRARMLVFKLYKVL